MLSNILSTIVPFVVAVVLGYGSGHWVRPAQLRRVGHVITLVVWVILWVVGVTAGAALSGFSQGLAAVQTAASYALATSVAVFMVLLPWSQASLRRPWVPLWQALLHPIKECVVAFAWIGLGVFCYRMGWLHSPLSQWLININLWLYALLFLIGVELTHTRFSRAWLSPQVLLIPVAVMVASLLAGALLSLFNGEKLSTALALSSGFGWFSLSGALAGQYLGESYAAVALLTDLLRELIGLTVVFLVGGRFAQASIGVCGATAADTTLPFVRKTCDYQYVPVALMSGLVLTLVAPFLMLFFMNL